MEQNRFDLLNFAAKSTLPQNSHLIFGESGAVKKQNKTKTNDTCNDLTILSNKITLVMSFKLIHFPESVHKTMINYFRTRWTPT